MNTFQVGLIKKALGDSENFAQILQSALELSDDENALSKTDKSIVLGFFNQLDSFQLDVGQTVGFQDYTFKSLLVQNFRKYGKPSKGEYFSLSFDDVPPGRQQAKSLFHVFLGDNGSGKSSLFDSMEFVSTGKISEATYRKINQKWFSFHQGFDNHSIIIKTSQCEIRSDSDNFKNKNIDVSRFFFSENSIMESSDFQHDIGANMLQDSTKNWYDFFLYAFGLDRDFVDFISENSESKFFDKTINALSLLKNILSGDDEVDQNALRELLIDKATLLSVDNRRRLIQFREKLEGTLIGWQQHLSDDDNLNNLIEKVGIPQELKESVYSVAALADYEKQLNDIKARITTLSEGNNGGFLAKQTFLFVDQRNGEDSNRTIEDLKTRIFNLVTGFKNRLNVLLSDTHFDLTDVIKKYAVIKARKFAQSQPFIDNISSESIDQLLEQLKDLRRNIRDEINVVVKEVVNEDFCQLLKDMFTDTFLLERENFEFDISDIEHEKITITVNKVPVHKYFNTFRYRLFYLTMQAAINLVKMRREHFTFPMVLDDIFYANDYKNKRQLFKFFNILEQQADKMLEGHPLQVIFFTHDEQLVSTLNRKKKTIDTCLWSFARIIEYEDFKNITPISGVNDDSREKTFKLYVKIYE